MILIILSVLTVLMVLINVFLILAFKGLQIKLREQLTRKLFIFTLLKANGYALKTDLDKNELDNEIELTLDTIVKYAPIKKLDING